MRPARTLLIGAAIAALVATGCEWHFETLDGHQNGPNGQINAQVGQQGDVILYNGRPHVFYWDNDNGNLRHAYFNGFFWAFEVLDGHMNGPNGQINADVGSFNAAVLYNGRPHVFYEDRTNGHLRHAYYNGQFWAFETLDGNGGPNGRTNDSVGRYNFVLLYAGRPHVFYGNATDSDLRHAYYTGSAWGFETLDGHMNGPHGQTTNAVGQDTSAVTYNWVPHVFYYDSTSGNLRHGYWNGQFWAFEALDGAGGPNGRIAGNVGRYTSALLYNGRPHVFYYADTGADLRHGYYNGQVWTFETLDGAGGPNGRVNAFLGQYADAILYGGRPRVYYQDQSDGNLRHAYYTGAAWGFETLDGHQNGPNGQVNSVVGYDVTTVVYNGGPHVFHMQSSGVNLRHAYFG